MMRLLLLRCMGPRYRLTLQWPLNSAIRRETASEPIIENVDRTIFLVQEKVNNTNWLSRVLIWEDVRPLPLTYTKHLLLFFEAFVWFRGSVLSGRKGHEIKLRHYRSEFKLQFVWDLTQLSEFDMQQAKAWTLNCLNLVWGWTLDIGLSHVVKSSQLAHS